MTAPTVDPVAWRNALPGPPRSGFERMLIVQCSLDWLRPSHQALREEIDEAVTTWCTRRTDLRIDRLVLHSLPTAQCSRDGDLARLNEAHAEWRSRLASTSVLLQHPALEVHRLIVVGGRPHTDIEDFIDLHWGGAWLKPRQSRRVLDLLAQGTGTTPLTGYDVDLDGPFGDADPSVYF